MKAITKISQMASFIVRKAIILFRFIIKRAVALVKKEDVYYWFGLEENPLREFGVKDFKTAKQAELKI